MTGPTLASPTYRLSESGMSKFDALCARSPITAHQRHLIEQGRTGGAMDQSTAWYVVERKESPQVDLIGTPCALI